MMKKYIFVFCRKGSKRLKDKSLQKIKNKTLFEITVKFASKIKGIDKIFISSDDLRLKKISDKFNCEFIKRPKKLAEDKSPEMLSWKHAVSYVKNKYSENFIFISLPLTAPLRKEIDVKRCIREVLNKKKDLALTITHTYVDPYFNLLEEKKSKIQPFYKNYKRYNLRSKNNFYCTTTVSYVTKSKFIQNSNNLFQGRIGYVKVPFPRSIDIDTLNDLKIARTFF